MRYDVQNSDWAVTAIPNIQYRLSDQWSGFSELVYRKAESQDNEYGLISGVIYALNERTQLDASVGVDLDGADKSYRAGLGMAFYSKQSKPFKALKYVVCCSRPKLLSIKLAADLFSS